MRVIYAVEDLPSGGRDPRLPNNYSRFGAGAFTPTLTITPPASSWGTCSATIVGAPGTWVIPGPHPASVDGAVAPNMKPSGGQSGGGGQGGDWTTPDVWAPSIYYTRPAVIAASGQGGASGSGPEGFGNLTPTRIINIMPVPAVNPGRVPLPAMRSKKAGGQRQIAWPRAFSRYPSVNRSAQPG